MTAGLSLAAADGALGAWWASLVLSRHHGTSGTSALGSLGTALGSAGLGQVTGTAGLGGATSSALGALGSVAGTAGAGRGAGSSAAALGSAGRLLGLLGGGSLTGAGGGSWAGPLRADAGWSLLAAVVLAAAALAVARRRAPVALKLAGGVAATSGVALVAVWPVADLVAHLAHGTAHRWAADVLADGEPVRLALAVALGVSAATAAVVVSTGRRARQRRLLAEARLTSPH